MIIVRIFRNFQSFVGLTPSGIVDSATKLKMVQKRCANKDIMDNAEPVVLRQGTVNWALDSSVPPMFSTAEMKFVIVLQLNSIHV
jgi:peptidoglycan hydrolase-like protein with peptidoglycan-binding domain